MERFYSTFQSTLMLFLFLVILLLEKANIAYRKPAPVIDQAQVAEQNNETVKNSGPFSWRSLRVLFYINRLPFISYKQQQAIWLTSQLTYFSRRSIFRNTLRRDSLRVHPRPSFKH